MIVPSDLNGIELFAGMAETLRARLASRAGDLRVNADEWVVHDGDPSYFWVVLSGEIEIVKLIAGVAQQVTTFDPGEYFGEVPLMLGAPAISAVRALRPSRLMRVEPADFHAMIGESPEAARIVAQTLVRRVNFISEAYQAAPIVQATIVGARYDFACHDLRDFLSRNQIAFEWLDPTDPADSAAIPLAVVAVARYPVVIMADGAILENPTLEELAKGLGLQTEPASERYDVIIVGGGPAGLAAAVYGGSEGLHTMMIEREAPGGQAGTSSRIENYLGFPGGVSGGELANRALLQAKRFGTEILVTRSVASIESRGDDHVVTLAGGRVVPTRAVVIATGVAWRRLETDGAENFVGRGIYYGAARTEALGTRGRDVFLIGGGNSAGQAAMFFSNYARTVTLLVRGPSLEKSMSYYLIEQLRTKENIAVETATSVVGVAGDAHLERIVTRDETSGATRERPAGGLFVFIGADAETQWLPAEIERDRRGYVRTGRDIERWTQTRPPYPLETSVPGIFAAGDVRSDSVKRVAAGVGEGSMVVAFIHQYFDSLAATAAAR